MTTIGYATLQIIPSLRGVSDAIDKELRGITPTVGVNVGKQLGGNVATGVRGSGTQISAALLQAVEVRGLQNVGQKWADNTSSAMAQHLQSTQNSEKLKSSLSYLVKHGDEAGKQFAKDMASNLAIELPNQSRSKGIGEKVGRIVGAGIGLGVVGVAGGVAVAFGAVLAKGLERLKQTDPLGPAFAASLQNANDAVGRLGAAFLKPVFGPFITGLNNATGGLNNLTAWVDAHQTSMIGFFEGLGSAAITGAENFAHGIGGMLQALGDLAGGLGNIKGALDTAMEVSARIRGDSAAADAFHKSAQEAYGWGESIRAAGDKLANLNLDGARNKLNGWADAAGAAATAALNAHGRVATLGDALGALPANKNIAVNVNVDPAHAQQVIDDFFRRNENRSLPVAINPNVPSAPPGQNPLNVIRPPGRASGGPIFGPGGPRDDKIPAWLSNGEHVFTTKDVAAMGGQSGVYAFRKALHRQGGGSIFPMAILDAPRDPRRNAERSRPSQFPDRGPEGKIWFKGPFNYGGDRPGMSLWPGGEGSSVGNVPPTWWWPTDKGLIHWPSEPKTPLDPWIWNRKGVSGLGSGLGFAGGGAVGPDVQAAGALVGTAYSQAKRNDCSGMVARVIARTLGIPEVGLMSTKNAKEWLAARGFKSGIGGPGQISVGWYDHGPNPNDGHMAMTLSDGSNAEAGGGVGDIFQIGGGAAGASNPEFDQHMYLPTVYGEGPAGSGAGSPSSSPFAGGSAAAAMTGPPVVDSGGGSSGSSSSSSSGGGRGLPSSIPDLAALPFNALGDFASGQVESLLGVLGVNGSPGWLQGVSKLIGGIKVSDSSGNSIFDGGNLFGSAAPIAANPMGTGTLPPDDAGNMHGGRAGQQPGPVYNITARDTEDAFIKAQRLEREKAAAKLSRF